MPTNKKQQRNKIRELGGDKSPKLESGRINYIIDLQDKKKDGVDKK